MNRTLWPPIFDHKISKWALEVKKIWGHLWDASDTTGLRVANLHHVLKNENLKKKMGCFQCFLCTFLIFPTIWTVFAYDIATTYPILLLWTVVLFYFCCTSGVCFHFDKEKLSHFPIVLKFAKVYGSSWDIYAVHSLCNLAPESWIPKKD